MILEYIVSFVFLFFVGWGAIEDIKYRAVSVWILIMNGLLGLFLLILQVESGILWRLIILGVVAGFLIVLVIKSKAGWADFVIMVSVFSGFKLGVCFWAIVMTLVVTAVLFCVRRVRKEGLPFYSVMGFSIICVYVGELIWTMLKISG